MVNRSLVAKRPPAIQNTLKLGSTDRHWGLHLGLHIQSLATPGNGAHNHGYGVRALSSAYWGFDGAGRRSMQRNISSLRATSVGACPSRGPNEIRGTPHPPPPSGHGERRASQPPPLPPPSGHGRKKRHLSMPPWQEKTWLWSLAYPCSHAAYFAPWVTASQRISIGANLFCWLIYKGSPSPKKGIHLRGWQNTGRSEQLALSLLLGFEGNPTREAEAHLFPGHGEKRAPDLSLFLSAFKYEHPLKMEDKGRHPPEVRSKPVDPAGQNPFSPSTFLIGSKNGW